MTDTGINDGGNCYWSVSEGNLNFEQKTRLPEEVVSGSISRTLEVVEECLALGSSSKSSLTVGLG